MFESTWKTRGLCLLAPKPDELELFEEFVEKILAPGGCNLLVLLTRYRYQFRSHPECASPDGPLNEAQAKRILDICRRHGIRLVPKMNLLGHQSGKTPDSRDGLLRAHPELDETPHLDDVYYCRSLCPKHPGSAIVFDLMDEMAGAFEADGFHIGLDEVFDIGKCPRCKDTPTYRIFTDWANALADRNRAAGRQTLMWGDRLLGGLETGLGFWEASGNFTESAIDLIDRDILVCDWHYEDKRAGGYASVDIFARAGLRMLACPWKSKANAEKFLRYAKERDQGHVEGFLATTWIPSGGVMRYMLHDYLPNTASPEHAVPLRETLEWLFR